MKFVALLSGGKDSIHSTLLSIQNGHELICCAHLAPSIDNYDDDYESYMYQTAGSEVLRLQVEECIGVPLYIRHLCGSSRNTSLNYTSDNTDDEETADADEVEDLYHLLQEVLQSHPEINAVSSGAILSTYQRTRIENVCSRLQLTSLAYLWRMGSQSHVLDSILQEQYNENDAKMEAVLVRVACPPGLTTRHLGASLRTLRDSGVLSALHEKWGMHVAGEGGEYETIVWDCALFKLGKLVLEETEVVSDGNENGVGVLKIVKCHVEKKQWIDGEGGLKGNGMSNSNGSHSSLDLEVTSRVQESRCSSRTSCGGHSTNTASQSGLILKSLQGTPNIRVMKGGLCHVSALLSPTSTRASSASEEAQCAVDEFLAILETLHQILHRLSASSKPQNDILFVHLYLSQIAHFAKINEHYRQYFGMHLPPSRSCVGLGSDMLPGGRRVMLDCVLQIGSGEYLRVDCNSCDGVADGKMSKFVRDALKNKQHALRKTLHVQSISSWAPVCIGPYSQANVLRSSLVFLAGMIGLVPSSMKLIQSTSDDVADWEMQLYQSWRNAASVLDGLEDRGGQLKDCLGGLVYFSFDAIKTVAERSVFDEASSANKSEISLRMLWSTAETICHKAVADNGGIQMGSVDGTAISSELDSNLYDENGLLYGGYEDEETWREIVGASEPSTAAESTSSVPLLMVCLAELPMNAQAEVELVCASRRAATCLEVYNGAIVTSPIMPNNANDELTSDRDTLWDTGYDCLASRTKVGNEAPRVHINCITRCIGIGCACISTITAGIDLESSDSTNLDVDDVLSRMVDSAIDCTTTGNEAAQFNIQHVLNVRLYYVAAALSRGKTAKDNPIRVDVVDDGTMLRARLHSILASKSMKQHDETVMNEAGNYVPSTSIPASTVVPVVGMHFSTGSCDNSTHQLTTFLAMQVAFVDAIRMETEMWIRSNRKYST
ncbi:hypothetical protein ACHAWO_005077 [Cyclotella atomus]|uniref:Diphthine--ammonia ligase n=1 Tax=Cyclotella atomus TaxID=382360 RepID=A0ABD3NQD7_9STRA